VADHGTAIEWTQAPGYKGETWNPVTGCDRVSPGCAHCYALELAGRLKGMGQKRYQRDGDPKTSGPGFGLTLHPDKLEEPLRWRKPRMVFVNSMSDLFHEEIPDGYIAEVFGVMAAAERHVFQVLTKRPRRMRALLNSEDFWETVTALCLTHGEVCPATRSALFLPNVWLGVTIENRRFVHRADLLRETPAPVRFISAEPLLGPLVPTPSPLSGTPKWRDGSMATGLNLSGIDWLIVGGESGPKHRRIDPHWVWDLRDACLRENLRRDPDGLDASSPAFFFKQWGGRTPKAGGRELDGRTWDEWPAVLAPAKEVAA